MKKYKLFVNVVITSIIFVFSACEKPAVIENYTCNLQTISKTFVQPEIEVIYKLEAKGTANVTSWYYWGVAGKVEINNPTVPSEVKLILSTQKKMQAGAIGNISEGSIKVSFKAVSADSSYTGIDQCEQKLK